MALKTTLSVLLLAASAFGQQAVIKDAEAKDQLMGAHIFRMQWLNATKRDMGRATFVESSGVIRLNGEQRTAKGDIVSIEGVVTTIDKDAFTVEGKIVTQVSNENSGRACERTGLFTFRRTGTRAFYRLQEMQNPCANVLDYVDIYATPIKD